MNIGFGQILLILLIILVIFGAGKLPKVMSDLARGLRSFREGMSDGEQDKKTEKPKAISKKKKK
jgi:sec-independent protein translocase protein TatA